LHQLDVHEVAPKRLAVGKTGRVWAQCRAQTAFNHAGPALRRAKSQAFHRLCPELRPFFRLEFRNFLSISAKAKLRKTVAFERAECQARKSQSLLYLRDCGEVAEWPKAAVC
jgi:hypothetical protein